MCFQRDLGTGFEAVQRRLEGQALDQYLLTVGGGYYFAPPPIREGRSWVRTLTEAEPT
jgi:deferrochelatase/peroxidase EfeB